MITREAAWELAEKKCDFALRRHLAHVGAAMRVMAEHLGYAKEADLWEITGILHDIDWNETITAPEQHCGAATMLFLEQHGVSQEVCSAIQSHYDYTGVPRDSDLRKALFAVDELSGFTVAAALMRPTRMIGITPKSVSKKMKDKNFAAAVSRDDMRSCESYFAMSVQELLALLIPAFEVIAPRWELGAD